MSDVIVIGGGVAGLSTAAHLAPFTNVTVLESEPQLGYHASGRSAAVFLADYGNAVVQTLNRASAPLLHQMGALSPRDFLIVARASQREAFEAECADFGATVIPTDAALAAWPILNTKAYPLAARYSHAFDMDTDLIMQHFARQTREQSGQIITEARVTAIDRIDAGWRVTTTQGQYEARHIVNAAGAWADPVAICAGIAPLGIQPYRRSMARLPAPNGQPTTDWPMVEGAGESWYAKPDAGALLVSPADEDPVEAHDAYADDMVLAEGLHRYSQAVTAPVTRVTANWAGLRSFAPDRSLVIGADPDQKGFWWCAGQGGYGFQTAPAAGQLLSDLILDRTPAFDLHTIAALSPDRLRHRCLG